MTVRKVVTRSGGHSRGLMPSIKNQISAAWESSWELKFYQLLELAPSVRQYVVQATREHIWVDGEQTEYIPDVKVYFTNGTCAFFEVKPVTKCRTTRVAKRLVAIQQRFTETSRNFKVITDEWLAQEPRASNVVRLMFHRRDQLLSRTEKMHLGQLIRINQPKTVDELSGLIGANKCWLLLGLSVVGVDLDLPLNANSMVFLDGGHRHADFFA